MADWLYELTPAEFEQAVAEFLAAQDYEEVEVIGGAGDLGVDIRCRDQAGALVVVQCKRYAPHKRVGSLAVQHFIGMAHHHGAQQRIFVTTARYTPQAIALARDAGVFLIDGESLAALIPEPQTAHVYSEPRVPVVIPYSSDGSPGASVTLASLRQLHPETPVTSGQCGGTPLTEEQQREWLQTYDRLISLSPQQFRKVCILMHVATMGERDRPAIRLLENKNCQIQDYLVMVRPEPYLQRCHRLPSDQAVTATDLEQFVHDAKSQGYGLGSYRTTGLFTVGALQAKYALPDSPSVSDGWCLAYLLLPNVGHWWFRPGDDFVSAARQPEWPVRALQGTERPRLLRRLLR